MSTTGNAYEKAVRDLGQFQKRSSGYSIAAAAAIILGGGLTILTTDPTFMWIGMGLAVSWIFVVVVVVTVLYRRAVQAIDDHYRRLLEGIEDA